MSMKRVEAKINSNTKENPATELDHDPNTWLIEGKLDEDIIGWEKARLDVAVSEINTEIIETSMSEPRCFTIRTRGKSAVREGKTIHLNVRKQDEAGGISIGPFEPG
jgi:hypothetical protein